MIVTSRSQAEWQAMAGFLQERAGVQPSVDLRCIGWVSEGKLVIVVGMHGFLGSVAQIHLAFAEGWTFAPREMLREVFRHAFIDAKREMLIGIVNSKNGRAMKMDAHLGFKELFRLPGMHDDGGDIVVVGLKKSECRYLSEPKGEPMVTEEAGHA